MELLKYLVLFSLLYFCDCQQEGNDSFTGNDADDTSATTDIWTSSTSSNDDNLTTPGTDFIIRRETTTDGTSDTTMQQSSQSVTTPKEKEDIFRACDLDPCLNGGVCLEDPFDSRAFDCMCPDGYTGNLCRVKDNCAADEEKDLCKMGYCSYSKDRLERSCKCFIGMFWDDTKEECKKPEPPCFPNPCINGGECKVDPDVLFKCNCPEGYEGSTCSIKNKCGVGDDCTGGQCELKKEENLKECTCPEGKYRNENYSLCEDKKLPCIPNPCEDHSQCQVLSNNDYKCNCFGHKLGKNCEIDNPCYSKDDNKTMCGGKGVCNMDKNPPRCTCNDGYYFNIDMRTCHEIIPPCFPNPCANDGFCFPLKDGFNCTCSEGYTGEHCKDPDFCVLQGGHAVCGDQAHCINNNELGKFQCQCENGSYFDFKERTCLEIDFCPIMMCSVNEQCANSNCTCLENFARNNQTNECEAHFCLSNPCPAEDMICTEGDGISDYYCSCKEGYSFNGTQCAVAVCVFPIFNDCEQICETSEEGYSCECETDFFDLQDDNKTCNFTGNTTCSNKTCDMGTCFMDDYGEEICVCPSGFSEKDGKCIDNCKSENFPKGICPDNLCESTNDGFRCKCEGKYKLSKDKVTCTNRKMCEVGEMGVIACLAKNATCVEDPNSDSGYTCQCTFPQKELGNGICQDICSNEEYQRNCSSFGASCDIDSDGEVICRCPPLYKQTRNGEMCNQLADVSYLVSIPLDLDSYTVRHSRRTKRERSLDTEYQADYLKIQNDAEKTFSKIFPGLIHINVLNCKKNVNYYLCNIELQFSTIKEEDLKRIMMPDICLSADDSLDKCLLPPSLILRKNRLKSDLSMRKSDPCDVDVKEQLCGSETVCSSSNSKKSFNCTCDVGYEIRAKVFPFADSSSFIEVCNDINECLVEGICPKYTKCENLIGSYSCSCLPGYRIKDKAFNSKVDDCVEICYPNPCDHGSCDVVGDGDFTCRCEAGFTGVFCDLTDFNFKKAQTNTIIVGAVLGGVLLVVLIIFLVTIQRLKKKKNDEPDQMIYAAEMNDRRGGAVNNAYQ